MSFQFNNNLFLRGMLRVFHLTPPDSARQPLIPYFQYKIGPYQSDHFLYFRREPSWLRYNDLILVVGDLRMLKDITTDLAAILRQFTELREYKVNTLQKKIAECNAAMQHDPRMEPLREALTQYFFG